MPTPSRAPATKTKAAAKPSASRESTASRSKGKTVAKKAPKSQDAIALLRADHTTVNGLFADYEKTRSATKKKTLVTQICKELSVHAQVEEEIFYPAVKAALRDKELVPEAAVEHATMKDLIAQVEGQEPDGEMFDAKIKVLSEYVKHHVKEEQNEMFTKARSSKLDLAELGAQILARKQELQMQSEGDEEDDLPAQTTDRKTLRMVEQALA